MLRVLHIINSMSTGGAETVIMNLYRAIDKNRVQFDFLLRQGDNNEALLNEIKDLGGRVFITPAFPRHLIRNYVETNNFFKEHGEYKIIHVHANALIYTFGFSLAKKYSIGVRLLHSHNADAAKPVYRVLHYINRLRLNSLATLFVACSKPAAEWMFGIKPCVMLKNGIDPQKYAFDSETRERKRAELGVSGKFAVCHVGRFVKQKNHNFLVDIFCEIYNRRNDAVLVLFGAGELEREIKAKIQDAGLSGAVIFAGVRGDINECLSAMDVMVFPSFFEGLPLALVEAQANSLPCVASDSVSEQAAITEYLMFLPLSAPPSKWADKAEEMVATLERRDLSRKFTETGFDISAEADKLTQIYEESVSRNA